MKKKFISRLLMLVTIISVLYSCRNDHFSEQETYNNSSQFQLTSKKISLNQSKHKARLIPELEKAEARFKAKADAFGKTVHYGDGVSINTDDVIYIENGPNYYTYTFNIIRDNAPANAPIENLVLSPLSDGTWRETLITYNLTDQEKQTIKSGGALDLTGKVGYKPLQSGTYSPGIMQKTGDDGCYWVVDYYFTTCSEGVHNHGELADDDGGVCQAEVQSVIVVNSAEYICPNPGGTDPGTIYNPGNTTYPETGNTGTDGGATTGGSTGGTTGTNSPCDENGIPTEPLDPNSTLGTQECNNGLPTLPNLSTEFFKFNKVISDLSPELQSWLNQAYNAEVYAGLLNYFTANNQSLEAGNFVKWSVNFLQQNPAISWSQFNNWFVEGYSQSFYNKLNLLSASELQEYVSINQEMEVSPYEEEYVKETNEAFVAFTSYADVDTMTDAQLEYVINQCCPSIIVVPQYFAHEKTKLIALNYKALRQLYPQWSKAKCLWEASRDTIQLLLDIGGTFPLVGEVCDITNGAIYAMNGDALNSALSFSAAIPLAGWGATAAKFGIKTVHLANGAKTTLKFLRRIDGVVTFGNRAQLRKVLGMVKGDARQAHHIIPWEMFNNSAVQKAALSSKAFHLNEALNGIPLGNAVHYGSHGNYNSLVKQRLDAIPSSYSPDQVYDEVMDLIADIRTAINNNPNTPINQLVF